MGSYLSKGKHQSDEDWVRNPYIADMIMSQDVNAWHERTSLIETDNPWDEKDCVSASGYTSYFVSLFFNH